MFFYKALRLRDVSSLGMQGRINPSDPCHGILVSLPFHAK